MIFIDSISDEAFKLITSPVFSGLTCNPTIIANERPQWGFKETLNNLIKIPGTHFIQGSQETEEWLIYLLKLVKKDTNLKNKFIIKLIWNPPKIKNIIFQLKNNFIKIAATGVYTLEQCYAAICCETDFIIFYYDHMLRNKFPVIQIDDHIRKMIELCRNSKTNARLLGASVKDIRTSTDLLLAGVNDLALPINIAKKYLEANFPENDDINFEKNYKFTNS